MFLFFRFKDEVYITNKDESSVGAKDYATASLRCTAKGNPLPKTAWISPSNAEITNQTDANRIVVVHTTTGGDDVYGYTVTSTLEIKDVRGSSDYGLYMCNSGNGVRRVDTLTIELNDKGMTSG